MRLAYVLPGIGMSDMEKSRRESRLNEIASSDTTVVVEEVRDGPRSIENAVDEYKAMPEVLRFIRGQQEKFDGFIIGCAGDSGLEGAREQSRKPVVGPGESSILLGTCGDKRFSMVTISVERARIKRRMVREAGLNENRLVSSHTLDIPVLELYRDKGRTQARLTALMREARERGAEAMLLGCMSVAFLEPERLRAAVQDAGIPLVNPIVTAVKMTEALVTMQRYGG